MRKFIILMAFVTLFAIAAITLFSFMGEFLLGLIISAILFCMPMVFWTIARITEGGVSKKSKDAAPETHETKRPKKPLVEETEESEVEEPKEEEYSPPPRRNVEKVSDELYKLKRVAETLEEERRDGVLSDEAYQELKKQNQEAIERLEQVNAKVSEGFEEQKVYCKKGKHYIDIRDCVESKIPGYVICQEHNEEIRVG